jgi:hypothetical protein
MDDFEAPTNILIVVSYVPQIKLLRDNISLVVVGAAFIVGRIGHVSRITVKQPTILFMLIQQQEFFAGAIFLFFKHPFDVGDNVWLYNTPETSYVKCIVKRLSLLYVVFERIDNGIEVCVSVSRHQVHELSRIHAVANAK